MSTKPVVTNEPIQAKPVEAPRPVETASNVTPLPVQQAKPVAAPVAEASEPKKAAPKKAAKPVAKKAAAKKAAPKPAAKAVAKKAAPKKAAPQKVAKPAAKKAAPKPAAKKAAPKAAASADLFGQDFFPAFDQMFDMDFTAATEYAEKAQAEFESAMAEFETNLKVLAETGEIALKSGSELAEFYAKLTEELSQDIVDGFNAVAAAKDPMEAIAIQTQVSDSFFKKLATRTGQAFDKGVTVARDVIVPITKRIDDAAERAIRAIGG